MAARGLKNVEVVEHDACTFIPAECRGRDGLVHPSCDLVTFSYSLSSEAT